MNKTTATFIVFLLTASAMGLAPAHAAEDPPEVIGHFERIGLKSDLTESHLADHGEGFILKAPSFASKLVVEKAFLDQRLPGWASDHAFQLAGESITFAGEDVRFTPFEPGVMPQFTMGSDESIRFAERPMWLSLAPTETGFVLDLDDGDTSGQDIRIAKEWLWERGIHRPAAVHEDGTELRVRSDDATFVISMPHFSEMFLTSDDIDIQGNQEGGSPGPHPGIVRWDDQARVLSIDVAPHVAPYEIMVERDWFNAHLPIFAAVEHAWKTTVHEGRNYVSVVLPSSAFVYTLKFVEFSDQQDVWLGTLGNASTVATYAFNDTIREDNGPVLLKIRSGTAGITLDVHPDTPTGLAIRFSRVWLDLHGLDAPLFRNESAEIDSVLDVDGTGWISFIDDSSQINITNGSQEGSQLLNRAVIVLAYNATADAFDVIKPGYAPWIEDRGAVFVIHDIPWNQTINSSTSRVAQVELVADDQVVATTTGYSAAAPDGGFSSTNIIKVQEQVTQIWRLVFKDGGGDGELGTYILSDSTTIYSADAGVDLFQQSNCPHYATGAKRSGKSFAWDSGAQLDVANGIGKSRTNAGGAATFMEYQYWACSRPTTTVKDIEIGFADRARLWSVGFGTWTVHHSYWARGTLDIENVYGGRAGHEIFVIDPEVTTYHRPEIAMVFETAGTEGGKRLSTCEAQVTKHGWIVDVLQYAATIFNMVNPYGEAVSWLVADRECLPQMEPIEKTYDDGAAAGGKINDYTTGDERLAVAFAANWGLGNAYDTYWTKKSRQQSEIVGNFRACATECGWKQVDRIYWSWASRDMYWSQE